MRKRNYNKKIIKTAVVTVCVLTTISTGIYIAAIKFNEKNNKPNHLSQPHNSTNDVNIGTSPGNKSEYTLPTKELPDLSQEVASTHFASDDIPAGKVLPEIESTISGEKVSRIIPKPDNADNKPAPDKPADSQDSNVGTSALSTEADYQTVDGGYFDDAVFIGNSRTEGLLLFTDINGINLAYTGLNVSTAYTTSAISIKGEKVPVMEAVRHKKFSKAYIMFGVNEVGWMDADTFTGYYRQIISDVLAVNPNTIVYVQSILPVTAAFEKERGDITNKKIARFNRHLKALADEQGVYFLNVAECVADSKGYLPSDASPDGYHMNTMYCEKWVEYLKSHAIVQ